MNGNVCDGIATSNIQTCSICGNGGASYACSAGEFKPGTQCNGNATSDTQTCPTCGNGGASYACSAGDFATGTQCNGTGSSDSQICGKCSSIPGGTCTACTTALASGCTKIQCDDGKLNSNADVSDGCEEDKAVTESGGNSAVGGVDDANNADDISSDTASGGRISNGDDNTDDTNTGVVFETVVGGGLFVCVLFVLVVLLVRKRRIRRNNENKELLDRMKHDHEADNVADATLIRLSSMSNLRLMETFSNLKNKNKNKNKDQGVNVKKMMLLKSKNQQRIANRNKIRSNVMAKVKKEFGQVKRAVGMNSNPLYRSSTGDFDEVLRGGDVEMSQMSETKTGMNSNPLYRSSTGDFDDVLRGDVEMSQTSETNTEKSEVSTTAASARSIFSKKRRPSNVMGVASRRNSSFRRPSEATSTALGEKKKSFRQHSRPSIHGGREYYENEESGETTWVLPDDGEIVDGTTGKKESGKMGRKKNSFRRLNTSEGGREYFQNMESPNDTTWVVPKDAEIVQ